MGLSYMRQDEFDRVFSLLDRAFPKTEKRSYKDQRALLSDDSYRVAVERDGGVIIGFISFWRLDGFTFIEHFATAEEVRGKGIGARFLESFLSEVGFAVLEAEPPGLSETAKRRVAFYERMGFVLNPYEYIQPPLTAGQPPIPLRIMSYKNALSEDEFAAVKSQLYTRVYRTGGKTI